MAVINQKEYLKKYLSLGDEKEKNKKRKKKAKIIKDRVKIIDDDVDISLNVNEGELKEFLTAEDAPQIVGIIDERPLHMRIDDYRKSDKWKLVGSDDELKETEKPNKHTESDSSPPRIQKKVSRFEDVSPRRNKDKLEPRRKSRFEDLDTSPPRRTKNYDSDTSPIRKSRKDSDTSPRRSNKKSESDASPRRNRKRSESDVSPPRKIKKEIDSDTSPPRKNKKRFESDISPPRKFRKDVDSDTSPPRKSRKRFEMDASPPRHLKKVIEQDSSPPRRSRRSNSDPSPPRRNRKSYPDNRNNKSRNKYDSDDKSERKQKHFDRRDKSVEKNEKRYTPPKKTLDGKTAGIQYAEDMKKEISALRKREDEMFKNMSAEMSGKDAAPIMRDRKTGKKRDLEKEAMEELEKQKVQNERKEKYDKWGRGLKQVEDFKEKLQEELHEMSKPLARYADDEDLEKYLREQEREGDPMLEYIRKKKKKDAIASGKPIDTKPLYEGEFMPNRYGIPPGHRWDGVDRSNGYEKEWFKVQNSKKAVQEDVYKWSIEDM